MWGGEKEERREDWAAVWVRQGAAGMGWCGRSWVSVRHQVSGWFGFLFFVL